MRLPARDALAHHHDADEYFQSQDSIDDGRDAGQVGDVHLDDAGEPTAGGVFLEVDGGSYSQGEGQHSGKPHDVDAAQQGGLDAGLVRMAGGKAVEEVPVDPGYPVGNYVVQQGGQHSDADEDRSQAEGVEYLPLDLPGTLAPLKLGLGDYGH